MTCRFRNLNQYILSVRSDPFEWGKHDCLTFSNAAFKSFHGYGFADEFLGQYMNGSEPMIPSELRRKFQVSNFDEAIEGKLKAVDHVPPRGSLIATKKIERWLIGYALGICVGMKGAFLSRQGVIYSDLEEIDKAWVPR